MSGMPQPTVGCVKRRLEGELEDISRADATMRQYFDCVAVLVWPKDGAWMEADVRYATAEGENLWRGVGMER